jgi:hypothetical protein
MSAISSKRPILTLNILNISETNRGFKRMGLDDQIIYSWEDFKKSLKIALKDTKKFVKKPDENLLITDGKCKERIIKLISEMAENDY